jgi:hypothetical protein
MLKSGCINGEVAIAAVSNAKARFRARLDCGAYFRHTAAAHPIRPCTNDVFTLDEVENDLL